MEGFILVYGSGEIDPIVWEDTGQELEVPRASTDSKERTDRKGGHTIIHLILKTCATFQNSTTCWCLPAQFTGDRMDGWHQKLKWVERRLEGSRRWKPDDQKGTCLF